MKVKSILLLVAIVLPSWEIAAQENQDWNMDDDWGDEWTVEESQGLNISGFAELAIGNRIQSDALIDSNLTLEEFRLRLESDYAWTKATLNTKLDLTSDGVTSDTELNWRELSVSVPLGDNYNLKLGRQILTWGTGDLVFLNDLFAKDWQSFFNGRDQDYLKAPSDAVKLSGYFNWFTVDLVWTPSFSSDNYIDGSYFSLFNPYAGSQIAPQENLPVAKQNDSEWALRLSKTIDKTEWALYGYRGFSKSPDSATEFGQALHAPKTVYGLSSLTPLGSGLFNIEFAYHRSTDDSQGINPLIKNGQLRALVGYEQEIVSRLTANIQLYIEQTRQHRQLLESSPFAAWEPVQRRTLITNRLTYRNINDTLTYSLFSFWSPSDNDGYLKPSVNYRYSDQWQLSAGGNLFWGKKNHSFFGQFKDASNVYLRIRYNF